MTGFVIIFGWVCVIVFGATVIIPYWRGKSDLLTTWNLFLIGAMNFVGYAAVQTGLGYFSYGLFENDDYFKLMAGTVVFFVAIYLGYYKIKWPRKVAGRTMRYWPEYRGPALIPLLGICLLLQIVALFANVQFLGQIILVIGPAAGLIATALCFMHWWNNKTSAVLLVLMAAILILAAVTSINNTTGRRSLLSVLVVLPFCLYWVWLRYKPKIYTVLPLILATVVTIVMMAGYTKIRHRYNSEQVNVSGRTPIDTAVESLRLLPSAIMELNTVLDMFGGDSMEASLVAINRYTKVARPQPFFIIRYVVANPFPRAWWPDSWGEKPKALGETLPRDIGVWTRTGYVNWGPGIPGHGFHEGGYHMLFFYGILFGIGLRYFDELLMRQPDNPFWLGVIATSSSQLIAFSRGDIALFIVMILGAVVTGLLIKSVGRIFVGYGLVYPSDAERAAAMQQVGAPVAVAQDEQSPWAGSRTGFAMQN